MKEFTEGEKALLRRLVRGTRKLTPNDELRNRVLAEADVQSPQPKLRI